MKKFVIHYLAPAEAMADMAKATPEEKAAGMKPWLDWKESMGDRLIDFGAPMMGAHQINPGGSTAHSPSNVTGYSIIQANDVEEAKSLLASHPHLSWREDVSMQVFECIEM